ncbi:MAG: hypothetical protein ACI35Q_06305, partial [Marinilabiliaceae bacterium]
IKLSYTNNFHLFQNSFSICEENVSLAALPGPGLRSMSVALLEEIRPMLYAGTPWQHALARFPKTPAS